MRQELNWKAGSATGYARLAIQFYSVFVLGSYFFCVALPLPINLLRSITIKMPETKKSSGAMIVVLSLIYWATCSIVNFSPFASGCL